jgi:hypothetical protein
LGTRHFVYTRPACAAPIAEKGAAARIEKGHAGNAPVARCRAGPGNTETGVTKGRAFFEGAGCLAIDTELLALGDVGDRLTDQRAAWGALDPQDRTVRAGLPAELLGGCDYRRIGSARSFRSAFAECLDAGHQLTDGRVARFWGRRCRECRLDGRCPRHFWNRGVHRAGQDEIAAPEAGQRQFHRVAEIAAMAKKPARGGAHHRQQVNPLMLAQPCAGNDRGRDGWMILGKEAKQARRNVTPGQ